MIRYRVYIVAIHTIGPAGRRNAVLIGEPQPLYGEERSIVVETNEVVEGFDAALALLNEGADPDASGGVRDFVVSASITIEPEGR